MAYNPKRCLFLGIFLFVFCLNTLCFTVNSFYSYKPTDTETMYFITINTNIENLTMSPLAVKIFNMQDTNTVPKSNTVFQNLILYDKIYNIVCQVNSLAGFGIVIYFLIGMALILSLTFFYVAEPEIVTYKYFAYKLNFSREYRAVMFLIGLWILIQVAYSMQKESEKTGTLLYELVSLYPDINDEVILHGLQMLNEKVEITASDLFAINFDITPGVTEMLVLFTIYLSVFVQINEY
ncbi:hypothetical protein NQ315_007194 [Exocentrus adspersus]|uniref:Gustatory receptor n=1 Tax=Exocentrus adspersus TaxID=1586481 RepID=A0AAV8WCR4_9CUCU|nr:hypothetical protein NQ315_007194 [Exocentrus adspersus]